MNKRGVDRKNNPTNCIIFNFRVVIFCFFLHIFSTLQRSDLLQRRIDDCLVAGKFYHPVYGACSTPFEKGKTDSIKILLSPESR